jgi:isopentenyl-diphosphate delta-isomerase
MNNTDYVVLVDEQNKVLGTAPKFEAHNANTQLHRGFSVFLFDHLGNLLLQQRSKFKKTFPLVWSNSCCGHPRLDETSIDAAKRHLENELGITNIEVFEVISDYRYETEMNNIFENEICPVLVCFTDHKPVINKEEVEAIKWIPWNDFLKNITDGKIDYSLWSKEEAILLNKNERFLELFKKYTK